MLATLLAVTRCGGSDEQAPRVASAPGSVTSPVDLPSIRERGVLRVLTLGAALDHLPREGSPRERERKLVEDFGQQLGIAVEWVAVDDLSSLLPKLLAGDGDVVAANLTRTQERAARAAFTTPVDSVRVQVVARATDSDLSSPADLAGRRLAVRPGSSHRALARRLREQQPKLIVEEVSDSLSSADLLDGVGNGRFDLVLADENQVRAALGWREDLRVAFDAGPAQLIAWAVRPDAPLLRRAADRFLASATTSDEPAAPHSGDLDRIRERGVLRVLTRNSATTYFVWRGERVGFEFELARAFARQQGLRLEMRVPPSRDRLVPWLLDGRGDVIAAGLTASEERAARWKVAFSRNYLGAVEMLVARSDDPLARGAAEPPDPDAPPASLTQLRGRTVAVRRSSSYWRTLAPLAEVHGFSLTAVPEEWETEDIIDRVAAGELDLTVADDHILAVERMRRDDVVGVLALSERRPHGWAVRPENRKLLLAIDAFFDAEYRGLFYNVVKKKYFGNPVKVRRWQAGRARNGSLSPFDDLIRREAARYAFDWRLIAAQVHQESRFDPDARSFAGARGLLQVLPSTAREMGVMQLETPEDSLRAGVAYLAALRDRLPARIQEPDRTWLALAAYNVGMGHLEDARRLAQSKGWSPDRWFDHVEKAMLLKQHPEAYRHTRFGYARGSETVRYVRAIRDRWRAYVGSLTLMPPPAEADRGSQSEPRGG